jgi:hypothetical protein
VSLALERDNESWMDGNILRGRSHMSSTKPNPESTFAATVQWLRPVQMYDASRPKSDHKLATL